MTKEEAKNLCLGDTIYCNAPGKPWDKEKGVIALVSNDNVIAVFGRPIRIEITNMAEYEREEKNTIHITSLQPARPGFSYGVSLQPCREGPDSFNDYAHRTLFHCDVCNRPVCRDHQPDHKH